jgi:GLPGLI family protein
MRSIIFALAGLFAFSFNLQAQQNKSGAIQFVTNFDPAAMAEANGMRITPEMQARMQSVKTPYELLFNATHASYTKVEEIEDSNTEVGNTRGFRMGGGSNRDYYYNFPDQKLTAAFDLRDTTYFMDTKLGKAELPMGNRAVLSAPVVEYIKSDETKKIIGLTCQKVTVKTTTKRKIQEEEKEIVTETVVWYTKDLGFDFSPNPALWTEGAVLAVEGKGNNTLATSIEYRKVSPKDVILPKKGTVITPEAYQSKMESMMRNRRGALGNQSGNTIRNIVIN